MSSLPRKGSVKANIRPSRQRPVSVEDVPSPVKPPVKQRVGAGLPGNPKAVAMRQVEAEAKSQRQQTVMFVNNIEYSDPVAVKNILDGAAKKAAGNAQLPPALKATASVLHRPRPVPRHKSDEEEEVTAQGYVESPATKGHERTKSNGSVSTRKSIFKANPGSPSQLPPLPPPPKHPGNQIRPRPNNTKSMTFDEKMDIFFPVPPGGGDNARSHFSPVPAAPASRPSFIETDNESGKDKSDRTTKTSFQTQSVVEIVDTRRGLPMNMRNTAKFSIDTETTTAVSQAWLPPVPSIPDIKGLGSLTYEGAKRQSSPVLPYPVDGMPMFADEKSQDDVKKGLQAYPRTTYTQKQDDQELMTIMLDPSQAQRGNMAERESWMADGELAIERPLVAAGEPKIENRWHQRIGKECPTFTNRLENRRSRKMVPPTPLLLRGAANKNMVIIRAAEPSPLESPSEAYQDIQAKLQKLEQPNRDSTGTEGRKEDLLANLEREMGMQEDHWHEMQNGLRDSISTLRTSPARDSMYRPASRMAGQGPANRGSLLKSNAVAQAQLRSPTPPYTDESDDDEVAARVVANQVKPEAKALINASLWKPSAVPRLVTTSVHALWTHPQMSLSQTVGSVTLASLDKVHPSRKTPARAISQPLDKLRSSSLWNKAKKPAAPSGYLWGATAPIRETKSSSRPLTQRPSRKSRRMTLLPDILESPQPLPDKRGTLGLYQFPWGEKSDTAVISAPPPRMSMAMPGTMTTGGSRVAAAFDARSRQMETEEYSSSFFDDYDDEGGSEDDSDFDMDDSDEDFDETTLWEIASLLKTDNIPSKMSLLPSSSESRTRTRGERSVIDENMQGNREDDRADSIIVALDSSILPAPRQTSLWVKPPRPGKTGLGLPQPDVRVWVRYIPVSETRARERPRQEEPALIESRSLWKPRKPTTRQDSLLWGPTVHGATKMWTAPARAQPRNIAGLFNPHHERQSSRATATINESAALHSRRPSRPRIHTEALPVQVSSSLWSVEDLQPRQDINWIATPIESRPHQPLRKHYRRPIASKADWEAALHEAIEASHPRKSKPAFATEQEWAAALNEALFLSRSKGNGSRRPAQEADVATGLWSKPREVEHGHGGLWQPGRTRPVPTWAASVSERTAPHKGRRMPEADKPLPVFLWQKMWRIQDLEPKKPKKDWLDTKSLTKKFKGIQFRY
ncbi:uncharacterized protein DNG_07743 [Cephalotrichum gorgonifer]|uniref:Uncharacterized protein n=1 Tax=Cephalotrichum gorgonifer TaxID=2041049 RepID=A0AAE8N466_9PEZI|nr:uncharacterized protein DNG_07743 [Cephalotrichum gorgonifer]